MSAGRRDGSHLAPILLGAMVGALIAGRLETGLLCLVTAVAAAALAGARWPAPRWFATLAASAAFAWLLNLYLTPGRPLAVWPKLLGREATAEGFWLGALLVLRMTGAFAAVSGLGAAWPGERAADELARVLRPLERLRVPVRETRLMLGLALRFAPLLTAEAQRIARVQSLRAGRPAKTLRERWQRRRAATVPTLVGALERAERVALGLEARQYRARWIVDARGDAGHPLALGSAALGVGVAGVALLWRR